MFIWNYCCQSPFPCLESQSTSPSSDIFHHCADLWTCCGGKSHSNLILLLCVLASNAHSYQNECVFICGSLNWFWVLPFGFCLAKVGLVVCVSFALGDFGVRAFLFVCLFLFVSFLMCRAEWGGNCVCWWLDLYFCCYSFYRAFVYSIDTESA